MMDITPPFWQARPRGKGINQRRNAGSFMPEALGRPQSKKLSFEIIHDPFRSKA